MKIIGFDLDGVICDWHTPVYNACNKNGRSFGDYCRAKE